MMPNRSDNRIVLDQIAHRVGFADVPEYWLQIALPERASATQIQDWESLPEGERQRIGTQYQQCREMARREVMRCQGRQQRIRHGIRSASVTIAMLGSIAVPGLVDSSAPADIRPGDGGFPAAQWFIVLMIAASLYGVMCKLGERCFDLDAAHEFGLRP